MGEKWAAEVLVPHHKLEPQWVDMYSFARLGESSLQAATERELKLMVVDRRNWRSC